LQARQAQKRALTSINRLAMLLASTQWIESHALNRSPKKEPSLKILSKNVPLNMSAMRLLICWILSNYFM